MRLFEMLQIIVNMVLIIIISKKTKISIQYALVGLNIIFLILHLCFEGIRYQMTFTYILLFAFVLLAALKLYNKKDTMRVPKVGRIIIKSTAMIILKVTG
ncbi:MAG TPA: hypothetical protein VIO64_12225 [Pseudobacteroides sp.]|uniref:hypothetical protein n=1 Tax=Pseudobacteroides sp. TaxID=1968840 RepID=UPI002F91EE58